jgi:hypothetical protein
MTISNSPLSMVSLVSEIMFATAKMKRSHCFEEKNQVENPNMAGGCLRKMLNCFNTVRKEIEICFCQNDSTLCSTKNKEISISFRPKRKLLRT